jgi:hypothetical protein
MKSIDGTSEQRVVVVYALARLDEWIGAIGQQARSRPKLGIVSTHVCKLCASQMLGIRRVNVVEMIVGDGFTLGQHLFDLTFFLFITV